MQTIKSSTSAATGKPANKNKSSNTGANGNGGAAATSQTTSAPNREEIASLAYKLYVESGCQEGRDLENWTQAEQMLRQQGNGQNRLGQTPARQESDHQIAGERQRQQF